MGKRVAELGAADRAGRLRFRDPTDLRRKAHPALAYRRDHLIGRHAGRRKSCIRQFPEVRDTAETAASSTDADTRAHPINPHRVHRGRPWSDEGIPDSPSTPHPPWNANEVRWDKLTEARQTGLRLRLPSRPPSDPWLRRLRDRR